MMRMEQRSRLTREIQAASRSLSRSFWRSPPKKTELSHILNHQSSFSNQSANRKTFSSNQLTLPLICSFPSQMTWSTPGHSAICSNLNKPNDRRSVVNLLCQSKHFLQLRTLQTKRESSTSSYSVTDRTQGRCSLNATLVVS